MPNPFLVYPVQRAPDVPAPALSGSSSTSTATGGDNGDTLSIIANIFGGNRGIIGRLMNLPKAFHQHDLVRQFQTDLMQAAQSGQSPSGAIMQVMQKNPQYFTDLPPEVIQNASTYLSMGKQNPHNFVLNGKTRAVDLNDTAAVKNMLDQNAALAGDENISESTIMRTIADLVDKYGPNFLTPENIKLMVGAIPNPSNSVTVMPQSLDPVLKFFDKQQVAAREDKISSLNQVAADLDEAMKYTTGPNKQWYVGPLSRGFDIAAPAASLLGADSMFGQKISTVGEARATIKSTIVRSAEALFDQSKNASGRSVLTGPDQKFFEELLHEPDDFWSSPDLVTGALKHMRQIQVRLQRQNKRELNQGGVTPTAQSLGRPSEPPSPEAVRKEGEDWLRSMDIDPAKATPAQIKRATEHAIQKLTEGQ